MDSDDEGGWEVMLLERKGLLMRSQNLQKGSAVLKMALNSTAHSSHLNLGHRRLETESLLRAPKVNEVGSEC